MRAFVAVDLAEATRQACAGLCTDLRREPAFDDVKVTWVKPANLHLTLQFLGEIEAARAERIVSALDAPWPVEPFEVVLGGCDAFPPRGTPRAIYITVRTGVNRLTALNAEVARRLRTCGVEPESRPFRPHLTIGRVRRGAPGVAGRIRTALAAAAGEIPVSPIDHVVLYESRLLPAGPLYEPLLRVALGAAE